MSNRLQTRSNRFYKEGPLRSATAGLAAATVSVLLAAAPEVLAGPRRLPVFGSGVDLVNLTVTVNDTQSGYVRGLTERDFEVLEDGVPQELSLFTREDLPLSLVVLLDSSLSMQGTLRHAQAAALRFVRTLRPQDVAQIVAFNERTRVVQDFTSDQALLQAAIDAARASGATALYNSLYVALKDLRARRTSDELRREAVIVLSDGDDTASVVTDDQVLELARHSGIPVYGIRLPAVTGTTLVRGPNHTSFFFTSLTRDTGGQVHLVRSLSQLGGAYDRLAEELRSQYSLGYISSNARRDGAWRKIVVRLKSLAFRLRHRAGYHAPKS